MIRVSSVFFGALVAVVASTAACKVSVETKTRYTVEDVAVTDTQDWNGEPITINIEGVGAAVNGGVNVTTDPNATRVTAKARVLAMAFSDHKADADLSIADVKAGFVITREGGSITMHCPHGGTHGDSDSGSSGCEKVNVIIPAGSKDKPLAVKVLSGNGGMVLQMNNATITTIEANSNGADSSINSDLPATPGGSISLVSEQGDDVTAKLPTDFAADSIQLVADQGKVGVGPFTDITAFDGTKGRGTAGAGLKVLKLTSKSFAGESGQVDLQ